MFRRDAYIPLGRRSLSGTLALPAEATSLVVVFGGSSGCRSGLEVRVLASHFELSGLATLAVDLLGPEEEMLDPAATGSRTMNDTLSFRVLRVLSWLRTEPSTRCLRFGLCGLDGGGAAALTASVTRQGIVDAIASVSGRPDLLGSALARVTAATLLVVSERDPWLVDRNQKSFHLLRCYKRFEVLSADIDQVEATAGLHFAAEVACEWFTNVFFPVMA